MQGVFSARACVCECECDEFKKESKHAGTGFVQRSPQKNQKLLPVAMVVVVVMQSVKEGGKQCRRALRVVERCVLLSAACC